MDFIKTVELGGPYHMGKGYILMGSGGVSIIRLGPRRLQ